MSTESLNRTSNNIETPSINLDVLKQKKETQKSKKVCFNKLNHRLLVSQKKDKFRQVRGVENSHYAIPILPLPTQKVLKVHFYELPQPLQVL